MIPELEPRRDESVFDRLRLSALAGTPLDMALLDRGIAAVAVVGIVLGIGLAPTVSHATDLDHIPVVIADTRVSVDEEARQRGIADVDYTLGR